jgi:phenylpropionate dioxygenase-like ring-hydroxylating dioxygenase large terminal subunit
VRGLIECADDTDPLFSSGWLPPERSTSAVGLLAENFLDVAHFPFVHGGTFGAAEEPLVPPFDVVIHDDGGGLSSTQEQWFDNPEDPGVVSGIRPMRQRRRATYAYRWPMQLILTLEELDAGAVKTILFFLQPEDAGSTRVYTKMLLHGIGGVPVPDADVVEREVAFEMAVLAEDLVLQQAMTVDGLPLRMRDELHVRSDRSGVALRRILADHRHTPPNGA